MAPSGAPHDQLPLGADTPVNMLDDESQHQAVGSWP